MDIAYLDWLADLFQEAQVPYDNDSATVLDAALRRIAGVGADAPGEKVYEELRRRWLRVGPPGRQLLAAHLRGEVYSRRDSSLRPKEGGGYYVNE